MEILTPRLRLVLQSVEDVENMIAAMSDADRSQVSPEWLASMRASEVPDPWTHGFRVLDAESSRTIGNCGFKGPPVDGVVEIAYAIDPQHERKGYATEAAQALVDFASSREGVRLIRAHTLPDGAASKRVLAKCGFQYVGGVVDPADGPVSRFDRAPTASFSDPKVVADYAERAKKLVPGLLDMQKMSAVLLAERAPRDARVLVVGAGGGMELKQYAATHDGWRFTGVDPSAEMLKVAKTTLGPLASRVDLLQGYVDAAPEGPFDAASCLLTLHFVALAERRRTLREIHRRLKPGAAFVATHISFDRSDAGRSLWLSRYAAFAISNGVDPEKARTAAATIDAQLPILSPEQDEALLREAGFADVEVFYVGLAFRGWIAHA
jgi:tRNA (cmo5U34)-methyltransferase